MKELNSEISHPSIDYWHIPISLYSICIHYFPYIQFFMICQFIFLDVHSSIQPFYMDVVNFLYRCLADFRRLNFCIANEAFCHNFGSKDICFLGFKKKIILGPRRQAEECFWSAHINRTSKHCKVCRFHPFTK